MENKKSRTIEEIQQLSFVESLYSNLHKKARVAKSKQQKFLKLASSYIEDGLTDEECIELLMIDGLSKESAVSYLEFAKNGVSEEDREYSFQFEDQNGNCYSSFDIGIVITASSTEDVWEKAENALESDPYIEYSRIISVEEI